MSHTARHHWGCQHGAGNVFCYPDIPQPLPVIQQSKIIERRVGGAQFFLLNEPFCEWWGCTPPPMDLLVLRYCRAIK